LFQDAVIEQVERLEYDNEKEEQGIYEVSQKKYG
jgi:hypothetical protein